MRYKTKLVSTEHTSVLLGEEVGDAGYAAVVLALGRV